MRSALRLLASLWLGVSAASTGSAQEAAPDLRRLRDTVGVILEAGVRDSAFPGAVAVIGTRDRVLVERSAGHLDWAPSPAPNDSTLWDLASLTKVTALTTAMMQLWERGLVDLDAPVQRYLPQFTGPLKDRVTVRHLLTHSSGLPAWRPLYLEGPTPDSILKLVYATPLDTLPGARMVYSDLGAILLGQIVVRLTGQPFDQYVQERIFGPLRMRDTRFRPPRETWDRVAPTEVDTAWRKRQVRGEVHDENAYALGGVSSHAGLFSSGRDMARFARMLLGGGALDGVRIVAPETLARFTALQDSALSNRALGWEKPNGRNSAGHRLSARAFGHTGFTGTSIWVDPEKDLFVVLLTNRVNPTRARTGIFRVRVDLADAVVAVLFPAGDIEGAWSGTSTCTDLAHFPACHDELVVYHVRPRATAGDTVTLRADKVVNGHREFMFESDFARGRGGEWTAEFQTPRAHGRWELKVSGSRMTGRLVDVPSGRMVRQLALGRTP